MDLQQLPDIFSLSVFIAGFRPLVRRVGEHANLWFVGWGCMLVHHVCKAFASGNAGPLAVVADVLARVLLALCGLAFVAAAARTPPARLPAPGLRERDFAVDAGMLGMLSVPVLAECVYATLLATGALHHGLPALARGLCALFLLPGLYVLLSDLRRDLRAKLIGAAFALYGLVVLPLAAGKPSLVEAGGLGLVFVTAAYLFARSIPRFNRSAVLAGAGLAAWGLSYPALAVYLYLHPGGPINRWLVALPQYMVAIGIILALLEEHVDRTERMAMHDPLTDLPNRRLFEERLVTTMEEARLTRTTIACLVIDVDNFKTINDTLGHTAGDQLLRALAVRLSWHMSPRDILARTGGDEFTALLAGVTDEHHLRFIASAMMSAASVPVMIDGMSVDVRISIGIALSPDHADDIDSLRRAADEAMYAAKHRGGGVLAFAGEME